MKMLSVTIILACCSVGHTILMNSHKLASVELRSRPTGVFSIEEPAEVSELKLGISKLGANDPNLQVEKDELDELIELEPPEESGPTEKPTKVDVICWAVKANTNSVPPVIFRETIVVATFEAGNQSIIFLTSQPRDSNGSVWQRGSNGDDGLTWIQDIKAGQALSDELMEDFLKKTNFGNNELDVDLEPIRIFLYRKKSPKLLAHLKNGIGEKARALRWQEMIDRNGRKKQSGVGSKNSDEKSTWGQPQTTK